MSDEKIRSILIARDRYTARPNHRDAAIGDTMRRAMHAVDSLEAELRDFGITDEQIRRMRTEARLTGDADTARMCCAALGLPTGDGAGGLLDRDTCRNRARVRLRCEYAHCQ